MDFVHDSIVAHVSRVVQSKKKTKGKDAELQLRVYVHLSVIDSTEYNPVLSDLLDMEVADVVTFLEEHANHFGAIRFEQRFVQRRVNLRFGAEILASLNEATVDGFAYSATGLTMRASAVSNGSQIGALSELIGTKVRLEIVSLQGELPLEPPATTKEKNSTTRKAKEAAPA